ncbi:MAG: hypothetical protein PHY47_12640 [Lachnospiraceae bacterium]|nr:hypothetical protein [Lachnospiraceae bacterium]
MFDDKDDMNYEEVLQQIYYIVNVSCFDLTDEKCIDEITKLVNPIFE